MTATIRVLLADDHPLIRAGIRAIVEREHDVAVVGEAADGTAVVAQCEQLDPDVVLLDLNMPGTLPRSMIRQLHERCPRSAIVILSGHADESYVRAAMAEGVVGYVLKDEANETVLEAVRAAASGGLWFSGPILAKMLTEGRMAAGTSGDVMLNERDHTVLDGLAQGWDNARIAGELGLAEQTTRNYLSRLYARLGVASRAAAIIWAKDHGFGAQLSDD